MTVTVLAACVPAAAWGQDDAAPSITSGPAITGQAVEGSTLTATADWTGTPPATASWVWLRCTKNESACPPIGDAGPPTYVVTSEDVGSFLRVRLVVTNSIGSDERRSDPTDLVSAAPPGPEPTPEPIPEPTPEPAPSPSPEPAPSPSPEPTTPRPTPTSPAVVDQPPTLAELPAGAAGGELAAAPLMLDPFPVVRIRGRLTADGARVTLFTVRASRGTLIVVRCRGESCPVRRFSRRASRTRVRPLERHLRAGTRLQVTVTSPGRIGKWTRIVIRRGAVPKRSDQCLHPGARDPVPCADR